MGHKPLRRCLEALLGFIACVPSLRLLYNHFCLHDLCTKIGPLQETNFDFFQGSKASFVPTRAANRAA